MTDLHGTPGLSKRSGMISLDLPDGAIPQHPGGVDDHHITLAYLGSDVDDKQLMHAVVATRRAAGEHGPLLLGVGGLGTFPASESSDGKTPAFVPVTKTQGLAALRESVGHLDASGRPDWTPHITLAYLDDPKDTPAPVSGREIPVRAVTVHRGDDSWSFPLRGSGAPGPAATKVNVGGRVSAMELGKVGPKGYIHGWIFVGAPGVGDEVYHPHHGRGKITAHDGKSVTVAFDKGTTHRFTAKPVEGAQHHFEPRSGNAVDHGHLADHVARDPKAITDLKDDELKGVDKELTDRAAALGRPGQVSKTHQKVKDEIARRGKSSAKTPVRKPKEPVKADDSVLVSRVHRDPKSVKDMSNEELDRVNAKLVQNARDLGKPDQVGRTHQKVKDEIIRRTRGNVPRPDHAAAVEHAKKADELRRTAFFRDGDEKRNLLAQADAEDAKTSGDPVISAYRRAQKTAETAEDSIGEDDGTPESARYQKAADAHARAATLMPEGMRSDHQEKADRYSQAADRSRKFDANTAQRTQDHETAQRVANNPGSISSLSDKDLKSARRGVSHALVGRDGWSPLHEALKDETAKRIETGWSRATPTKRKSGLKTLQEMAEDSRIQAITSTGVNKPMRHGEAAAAQDRIARLAEDGPIKFDAQYHAKDLRDTAHD